MTRRFPGAYWAIVAVVALLAAAWVYYDSTRPFLDCPDGHCPDPGSREYLSVVQRNIDRAPLVALAAFALVVMLGVFVRALILTARALRRQDPPEA
jgi:hypothetical protein